MPERANTGAKTQERREKRVEKTKTSPIRLLMADFWRLILASVRFTG